MWTAVFIRVRIHTAFLAFCAISASLPGADIPEYGYTIVHAYPHDRTSFTEGIFYHDGFLYESAGLNGHSSIRKIKLETGEILLKKDLPPEFFGEGIVAWKDRLVQLTYTTETGFIYDLESFALKGTFHYRGQGWALTHDGKRIIMDNGTPEIRFWDPETLHEIGRIRVTSDGEPVQYLNELEWVKGEIFANVWHTDRIARINPTTGNVNGWIDLAGLLDPADRLSGDQGEEQVLNGIAYDAVRERLFVTGKYWPKLFEIRLQRKR